MLGMIGQDNRLAFNMFYDLYYDRVFRYAYYFLKDAEGCKEIITDVFFGVWQSREKLTQVGNMETYLFIAVRNEVTRYTNKLNKHERISLDELPVQLEVAGEGDLPDDRMVYEEMEELLGRIIGGLPEKCRLIFLMARQDGLKPKEIAEKLSISENTVRVQMKIAIDKIISQIKPYYPDLTLSFLFSLLF